MVRSHRSTSGLGSAVVLMLTVTGLGVALPAAAADSMYHLNTSAPDGRAVCTVEGSLKKGATQFDVMLSPTMGEANLDFAIASKGKGTPTIVLNELGAGTQAGCDIFPDTPTSVTTPWTGQAAKFFGVLDVHAHPGSDCLSSGVAEGMVTLSATGAKLKPPKCDSRQSDAHLQLKVQGDTTGTKGQLMSQSVEVHNHGPADATNPMFMAKFSRNLFLKDVSTTKGLCHRDSFKNTVRCDVGPLPTLGTANVTLFMLPLKSGPANANYAVIADNGGTLVPGRTAIRSDIAKGNNAILTLIVKCKGAAGTVTINPNGTGAMTTCTCPDPNDATLVTVTCIETYAQKTTVALTPAATTGAFNKWTGDCAGNPAACSVTLDPGAQSPDKSATAKFK